MRIPYRVLLPRQDESANLLVAGCISASHITHTSFRMESQYMIAGPGAGVSASLGGDRREPVHEIDFSALRQKLSLQGQTLHLNARGNGKKP